MQVVVVAAAVEETLDYLRHLVTVNRLVPNQLQDTLQTLRLEVESLTLIRFKLQLQRKKTKQIQG